MPPSTDEAPDLSGLIELSRVATLDLKPVILRVQTDLFVQGGLRGHNALGAYEALAGGMIPAVDEDTALIVARKLAPLPETPETLLVRLAERGGAVRDVVIASAPVLGEAVLAAARRDGTSFAMALAARTDLDRSAQAELSAAGEEAVDLALARNPGLRLKAEVAARLVARARALPDLAAALLARADLAPDELAPLFLQADETTRGAIVQAVEAVAALRPCPPARRELGDRLAELSERKDVPAFVAALAEGLGLPASFLKAAPDAVSRYDLLTLALRAAGLDEEDAVFIFLTLNDSVAQSAPRVFALVRLFRTTSRPAARDLVAAICDRAPAERRARPETHAPYHAPETPKPRPAERQPMRPALPGRNRPPASEPLAPLREDGQS